MTNLFHLNNNNPPGAVYATTGFDFWTLSLSITLKMCKKVLKNIVILALVSHMMSLFSRKNPPCVQISLIENYAILQLLKKFNGTAR